MNAGTMDKYRIDGHKLMFHPRRVARWLDEGDVYPLYVEISPAGSCNHRCTFCALDYVGYPARALDADLLMERLSEMGRLGVKSAMFAGEGEPLLHGRISDIVNHAKGAGIDTALTTNGTLLSAELFRRMGASLAWVRVSINAGTAATYARLHRTFPEQFEALFDNLSGVAAARNEAGYSCTLGAQLVLLPDNAGEVETLARRVKDAGLDYLAVKPYSQHGRSITREYERIDYSSCMEMAGRLQYLNDERFRVVFRTNAMLKSRGGERGYGRCLALPFWAYLDSGGTLWGCGAHIGDERFRFGSITEQSFEDLWLGERRRELTALMEGFEPAGCRDNCRMDEINRYLWELTHPAPHVNFI